MVKKLLLLIYILLLVNPSGFSQSSSLRDSVISVFKSSLLNKPLKSFHFTDINNNKWGSNELKGKILIINFWFTACKPCIQEMPYLNQLVSENKDSVIFLAPAPENETQIRRFLKKYSFDYHIIPSSLDYITSMNIENFPAHLVVDKQGIIRQVFIGYADDIKQKLQAEIERLIK
jgi:thiol-disulfide isomerase/thioredoxin